MMDDYVLEKQVATNHEYQWIVTALKGMASPYANKSLEQMLAKMSLLSNAEGNTVSVDFGVAREDDKINSRIRFDFADRVIAKVLD